MRITENLYGRAVRCPHSSRRQRCRRSAAVRVPGSRAARSRGWRQAVGAWRPQARATARTEARKGSDRTENRQLSASDLDKLCLCLHTIPDCSHYPMSADPLISNYLMFDRRHQPQEVRRFYAFGRSWARARAGVARRNKPQRPPTNRIRGHARSAGLPPAYPPSSPQRSLAYASGRRRGAEPLPQIGVAGAR